MRAHNRLESRYSNSSGGSYDDDKSECVSVSRPGERGIHRPGSEGKMVTSMMALIMYEQCKAALGSQRASVRTGTQIKVVEPGASALLPVTQNQVCSTS